MSLMAEIEAHIAPRSASTVGVVPARLAEERTRGTDIEIEPL
jgi:hypothetical protein